MYSLAGKTALATGSVSGVGLGIARSLSRVGCNIVVSGFAPQHKIDATVDELTTKTNKVKFIYADLSKPKESTRLVKDTIAEFGGIDILVNNAAKQHVAPVEEFPDEAWEEVISVDLSSCFYTSKAALGYMRSKNWGRIINIAH
jgi:3-hydroxybutyrate dehydrogenase